VVRRAKRTIVWYISTFVRYITRWLTTGRTDILAIEKLGGGKEYTFGLGTLFAPSDVDFEPKSSKVRVDKVDSHNECIAIRKGKGTVVNV
jgi:hypothetical protein